MTVYEMISWLCCFKQDDTVYISFGDNITEEFFFEERMDGCEIALVLEDEGSNN